jgi:putative ABC transport system ATP-binding protein
MTLMSDLHHQGSTIVMVTHDDDIAAYAERIIQLRDGEIETDEQNGDNSPAVPSKEVGHAGK